jgi:hypothetical protein
MDNSAIRERSSSRRMRNDPSADPFKSGAMPLSVWRGDSFLALPHSQEAMRERTLRWDG